MTLSHEYPTGDPRVGRLQDRAEIGDVQLRYATGTDSHDWELFRSCFADEIEVDFRDGFGQPAVRVSADEWVKETAPRMESFTATQHMITNLVITFADDDQATCVAYVRASHHLPNSTGDSDQIVYGYYTNRFRRTSSGWRIVRVELTTLWMTGNFGIFGSALGSGEPSRRIGSPSTA